MKKVKIMLTAIAVLAVVGGALAFKARVTNVWCGVKGAAINTVNCPLKLKTTFVTAQVGTLYCTDTGNTCDTRAASTPND
jgi:hypothetical protein